MKPEPISVVIVSFPDGIGGPQRWLNEILPWLRSTAKLEVDTWYPAGPYRGLRGKIKLLGEVRKRFAGQRHKVIYLSLDLDLASQIVACLSLLGFRRVVVHAHAAEFRERSPLLHRMYRFLVRRAAAWVAVSEQAGNAMFGSRFGLRGKIIPTSIDFVGMLQRANLFDESSRPKLSCPSGGRIFAYVGRLSEEKGVDIAIKLFARHSVDFPNDRLLVVGDGPQRTTVERLAKSLLREDSFRFTGAVDNVGLLLKEEIDCILIPSLFEGQCRVAAEAQFFGATVIASGAVPDIGFLDPATAVRIPVSEPERWRRAMAGVCVKSSSALMAHARRLEQESHIGIIPIVELFEKVVLAAYRTTAPDAS